MNLPLFQFVYLCANTTLSHLLHLYNKFWHLIGLFSQICSLIKRINTYIKNKQPRQTTNLTNKQLFTPYVVIRKNSDNRNDPFCIVPSLVSSEGSCDLLFKYLPASPFRWVPCHIYWDSGFQNIFESIYQYILYLTGLSLFLKFLFESIPVNLLSAFWVWVWVWDLSLKWVSKVIQKWNMFVCFGEVVWGAWNLGWYSWIKQAWGNGGVKD